MNELLFSCQSDRLSLENILAYNQIKKCDKGIEKYCEEISLLKKEISDILASQGIKENYVEIISKYKEQLKNIESNESRSKELDYQIKINDEKINNFNLKIKELEAELEELKRNVFEANDAKEIVDSQNEIESVSKKLVDLYDLVENVSNDNTANLIELEFIKNKGDSSIETNDLEKVELSNELHRISVEFDDVVRELELSVRENIEFCMKKINNREKEIVKYEDRKSNIVAEYPKSLNLDYQSEFAKLSNLFDELGLQNSSVVEKSTSFDSSLEKTEEIKTEEKLVEPEQIKEETNIFDIPEEEEEVKEEKVEDEIEEEPTHIENDMIKVESIEKPDIELKEVEEASQDVQQEEPLEEDDSDDVSVDNSSFSTIGSVPYIFSEGESLESIAEKVYPSKDCWEAIYNYNKEEINSYLTANGMSCDDETIKALASDKYLFAGIQLNIPTDCNYRG